MSRPRVLLVEDDVSIRRFVALALEDAGVDLVEADNVPQARQHLANGTFALVITDLMMPGETGLDLLQHLALHPDQRGVARLAVFSAGLNAAMKAQLSAFDVWRLLPKPLGLAELERCVREAVDDWPAPSPRPASPPPAAPSPDSPQTPAAKGKPASPAPDGLDEHERSALARHFEGELDLFRAYRASCRAQFAADLRQGDDALARGDTTALRHLAHSLKSVLLTLGRPEASTVARQLEDACADTDTTVATPLWHSLRGDLMRDSAAKR